MRRPLMYLTGLFLAQTLISENLCGWLRGGVVKDNPRTIDSLEESRIQNFIELLYTL